MSTKRQIQNPPQAKPPAVFEEFRTAGFRASTPVAGPCTLIIFREVLYTDANAQPAEAPDGAPTFYEYPIIVDREFVAKYPDAPQLMARLSEIFDLEDKNLHPPTI